MDIKEMTVPKVYVRCCVRTMENTVEAFVIVKKAGKVQNVIYLKQTAE